MRGFVAIGIEWAGLALVSVVVGYLGLGTRWVRLVGAGNGGGIGFLGVWMGERVVLSVEIMSGVELGWFGQDCGWIGLRGGGLELVRLLGWVGFGWRRAGVCLVQ